MKITLALGIAFATLLAAHAAMADAGADAGNGATTERVDSGATPAPTDASDDGGCSTTGGSASGDGLAALGLGLAGVAFVARARRRRR